MCVKDKCHCDHSLAMKVKAATCNTHCRDTCLHYGVKFYSMGGEQPTLTQCVEACGCDAPTIVMPNATETQLNLIASMQNEPKPLYFLPIVNQSKLTQDITFVLQAFSSFIICVGLFCGFAYNIDKQLQTKPSKTLQHVEDDDQEFQPVEGNTEQQLSISRMKKDDDAFEYQAEDIEEEKIVLNQRNVVKRTNMYQEEVSESESSSSDLEDDEEDDFVK